MYSKEVAAYLKEKKIGTGDALRVDYNGISIEGTLMPKTDVGNPDTLIIKLKNGYNIGVQFSNVKITKLSEGLVTPGLFPDSGLKQDPSLPKVSLIFTGGTIGSKIDYKTGAVEESKLTPGELLHTVPELSKIAKITIKNPFSMPSQDIAYVQWQTMAKTIEQEIAAGARGIVLTMGTDTMAYTSAALSFMLQGLNAPVVITGSQRSPDRGSSDAFMNLICAAQFAARSDIAEVGICMHSSSSDEECFFLRGTKARKMHTSRRDAFRPMNDTPIAYATQDGKIRYIGQYNKVSGKGPKMELKTKFDSKVALVKVYPGSDPKIIGYYLGKGVKGIILEGTGLGNTPVSTPEKERGWLDDIKEAVKKGVIVAMASQTLYGRVNPDVYTDLRLVSGAGVVYCEDMLPETAYVKLGWLLGNYSAEKAKELLNKNIVGEINQRTGFDEFLV